MSTQPTASNREPENAAGQDRYELRQFADAEALRAHMDALNDSGEPSVVVGWDVHQPFLIALDGPYVESEVVFFDSPWAGHDIANATIHCDECRGEVCGIDHLRFPVTVMTP